MFYEIYADGVSIMDNAAEGKTVLDPLLSREVSTTAILTLGMPRKNVYYGLIKPYVSTLEVREDGHTIFIGRALPPSLDMDGTRRYRVEGAYAWLNDVIIDPAAIPQPDVAKDTSTYITNIIDYYNTKVSLSRQLDVTVLPAAGTNLSVRDWKAESCADAIGRELDEVGLVALVRHVTQTGRTGLRVVDYRDYISNQQPLGQVLEWGKNITKIEIEGLSYVTALHAKGDGIELWVEEPDMIAASGYICGEMEWQEISDPADLRARALTYLRDEQPYRTSHVEVSAVDLHLTDPSADRLELARPVQIDAAMHGVPGGTILPISAVKYRLDRPQKDIVAAWPEQVIPTLTGRMR